jgi:uncharacterized protein HemX
LGINVIFKFITPYTIGLSLDRAQEMLAGALIPFALLAAYELWAYRRDQVSEEYLAFANRKIKLSSTAEEEASGQQNQYGLKVLAIMLGLIGLLMLSLGLIAEEARALVSLMGALLIGLAFWMYSKTQNQKQIKNNPS